VLHGTFKKSGKGVTLDGKPIKGAKVTAPDDNTLMYGPLGVAAEMMMNLPKNTFMVYLFDTEENAEAYRVKLRAGELPLMFRVQSGGLLRSGVDAIDEVFKRAPKGCIAVYRVSAANGADDHESWTSIIYVDMMSVRKQWQRKGINTMMIDTFRQEWPGREVKYSKATKAGQAFIASQGTFSGLLNGSLTGPVPLAEPTAAQIVEILQQHPLIRLEEKPKRVFIVGSFARGQARPKGHPEGDSDVDVLLEVRPKRGLTALELEDRYRRRLREFFMRHGIRGKADDVHPQWDGRRVDVYFTYDADAEPRPKRQLH
jgi:hypothetical protein